MRRNSAKSQAKRMDAVETLPAQPKTAAAALARMNPFTYGLLGALGVLVALMIGGIVDQLATVLVYIGVAVFLALGLDPIVTFIERKLPRPAAVAIVVSAVILAFAGIILAIVPILVEQISNLIEDGPKMIEDFMSSAWFTDISEQFGSTFDDAAQGVLSFVQDPGNILNISGGVFAVGAGIAGGFTGVTIVLILTLYFMASLRSMKAVAARFVPAYQRDTFRGLLEDVSGAVGRYVMGQASLALINGILSLIVLSIIGAPVPALLALIAFIGSMIPLVGTLSASIINALICLIVSPVTALIAFGYYLVYMQVEAYILSPRIMNKAVAVPGALVVIAAVAGGALGGILGALVAIPVAASAIIIVQKVVFPAQDRKIVPPGTLSES
ncbi:AI-2E family transporter [Microbacterium sp. H83]|uniref:AI-2E family transporter n=1 Tax=Microbacterium sp. H83 TaxID=1827324 RepID=UPI0009EE9A8D|nr:AI-2E family transporter [Microbacterium sp. H83]